MRVTAIAGCLVLGLAPLVAAPAAEQHATSAGEESEGVDLDRLSPEIPAVRTHEVSYEGDEGLRQDFQLELTQPTAMVSADFDEDGVQDLVCGHVGVESSAVVLHRGNIDSIFPHSAAARQRKEEGTFTDAPFLSPARVFAVPGRPDFLAAGDFDNDGRADVVAAARGGRHLFLMSGDGNGSIGAAQGVPVPGAITTMIAGEINRADGLPDVALGIIGRDGPRILVFQGPRGATRSEASALPVPTAAGALALGHFDDDPYIDLATGAGHALVIVQGGKRSAEMDLGAEPAVTFSSPIVSIAWGDFIWETPAQKELAILTEDGWVYFVSRGTEADQDWAIIGQRSLVAPGDHIEKSRLIPARISGLPTKDLVVIDPAEGTIKLLAGMVRDDQSPGSVATEGVVASAAVNTQVPAILPMRLNADALTDLVLPPSEGGSTRVATTQARATIEVNTAADDTIAGNGSCTLREAINNSNGDTDTTSGDCTAGAGTDEIAFRIGGGGILATIQPLSALPAISDPVTINGNTQACASPPCIELDGQLAGSGNGLALSAGGSSVRGMVINGFPTYGIYILSAGNIIEGNYVGTDVTGSVDLGNGSWGLYISAGENNVIGGTAAGAGNLVSGNGGGLYLRSADRNELQGNLIGTNVSGTMALGNGLDGVRMWQGSDNNTVGGTTVSAGNVISSNAGQGVSIAESTGNGIQGNFIGTDASGTMDVGNGSRGVRITSAPGNTVGGNSPGARNIISGNDSDGVYIQSLDSTLNAVLGNYIGTDVTGTASLGNTADGIRIATYSGNNTIGGPTPEARNIVSGNGGNGIFITVLSDANQVRGNFIGTGVTGTENLANSLAGIYIDGGSNDNTIGGVAPEAQNVIAYNLREGVVALAGIGNAILGNSVHSNGLMGIDLGNSDGVTPNDPDDPDAGPNNLQNFPVLTLASATPTPDVTIEGSLNSIPLTSYRIEFFANTVCDPAGCGEGERFLGFTDQTTDGSGDVNFSLVLTASVADGEAIVATATDPGGSTSEYAVCFDASCSSLVAFGQTIVAPNKDSLGWMVATDIGYAKGNLAEVSSYTTTGSGWLAATSSLDISGDEPDPGNGLYYLVEPLGCGSWQTSLGSEPGRDAALP